MRLLNEDEWPHSRGNFAGVVTLIDDEFVRPFLLMRNEVEIKTGGSSGLRYLEERTTINAKLARVAEIFEIETLPDGMQ